MILLILFYLSISVFLIRTLSFAFLTKKKGHKGFYPLIVLVIISAFAPIFSFLVNH